MIAPVMPRAVRQVLSYQGRSLGFIGDDGSADDQLAVDDTVADYPPENDPLIEALDQNPADYQDYPPENPIIVSDPGGPIDPLTGELLSDGPTQQQQAADAEFAASQAPPDDGVDPLTGALPSDEDPQQQQVAYSELVASQTGGLTALDNAAYDPTTGKVLADATGSGSLLNAVENAVKNVIGGNTVSQTASAQSTQPGASAAGAAAAAPSISASATPGTIPTGSSTRITWSSLNAASVIVNGQSQPLSGSLLVAPTATTTYALTAYNSAGQSVTTYVTVTVGPVGTALTGTAVGTSAAAAGPSWLTESTIWPSSGLSNGGLLGVSVGSIALLGILKGAFSSRYRVQRRRR